MRDNNSKIFEDWEEIDCNDCSHYWDNSCDGVKTTHKGSKMLCNSFIATRSVIIPLKIKRLERLNIWLSVWCLILTILIVGLVVWR